MQRRDILLLVLIVLIGAFFRFNQLETKSLWSDEIATIASAMGNSIDPEAFRLRALKVDPAVFRFQEISFDPPTPVTAEVYLKKATASHGIFHFAATANVLKDNVHPPLFFWLMNVVIHWLGTDPFSLRLPAVVFGILTIPAMFLVGRRLHSTELGLLSAALMAFSAYQISHAQDARQYTLLTLLALLSVWLALRLASQEKGDWREWFGLTVLSALGLYSQYFYVSFVGFIYLYLICRRWYERPFFIRLVLSGVGVVLLMLPWVPYFQVQLAFLKEAGHYTQGLWKPLKLPETIWRSLNEFLAPDNKGARLLAFIVLAWAGLGNLWLRKRAGEPFNWRTLSPTLTLCLFWLVVLIGGQMAIDLLKNSHTLTIRRYLLLVAPAYYLLIAYALLQLPTFGKKWLRGTAIALMLALILSTPAKTTSSDEFKQAAHYIETQWDCPKRGVADRSFCPPGTVSKDTRLVLVNKSGAMAVGMAYYLAPGTMMLGVPVQSSDELADGSPLMVRLERLLPQYSRIEMVYSHEAPSTRNRLNTWLVERGYELDDSQNFPGVKVFRFFAKN